MSKGPGRTQQAVISLLADDWQQVTDLAARITAADRPDRAAVESVRRACKRLAALGRAELDYVWNPPARMRINRTHDVWSELGEGRSAEPGCQPLHSGWHLAVRIKR